MRVSCGGKPLLIAGVAAWVMVAAGAGQAQAYPQWQLTTGAVRCNECHYAPGGGGLITPFARDAIGSELSTFEGDGMLLHGKVSPPRWLALGGDLRGAFVANGVEDPNGTKLALFPMQADLHGRVAFPRGLAVAASVGYRGQIRESSEPLPDGSFQGVGGSRFISREHYLVWQPQAVGPYLRAGRFYAPFGLRFAEHVLYVRRDLGFDHLRETYNLSGGYTFPGWELHLTVFGPDFARQLGSNERGFAAYYERRLADDRLAVAGQARVADAPGVTRLAWGGVGKLHLERLRTLLLAELDAVHLLVDGGAGARAQVIALLGAAVLPVRGLMVTLLGERNQIDVRVRGAAWSAGTLLVNWFPYPHFEVQLMGRLQLPADGVAAKTLFTQLHYFF